MYLCRRMEGERPPANNGLEAVRHLAVVDVALSYTVLAGCRCWFSCASAGILYLFFFLVNGERNSFLPRFCILQMLRMKQGI